MRVINKSHGDILTDYDGKRYCIPKGKTVDIPSKVYDQIKASGSTEAFELQVMEEPVKTNLEEVLEDTDTGQSAKEVIEDAPVFEKMKSKRGRKKKGK